MVGVFHIVRTIFINHFSSQSKIDFPCTCKCGARPNEASKMYALQELSGITGHQWERERESNKNTQVIAFGLCIYCPLAVYLQAIAMKLITSIKDLTRNVPF